MLKLLLQSRDGVIKPYGLLKNVATLWKFHCSMIGFVHRQYLDGEQQVIDSKSPQEAIDPEETILDIDRAISREDMIAGSI